MGQLQAKGASQYKPPPASNVHLREKKDLAGVGIIFRKGTDGICSLPFDSLRCEWFDESHTGLMDFPVSLCRFSNSERSCRRFLGRRMYADWGRGYSHPGELRRVERNMRIWELLEASIESVQLTYLRLLSLQVDDVKISKVSIAEVSGMIRESLGSCVTLQNIAWEKHLSWPERACVQLGSHRSKSSWNSRYASLYIVHVNRWELSLRGEWCETDFVYPKQRTVGKAKKKYKVILKRNVRATLEPTVKILAYVPCLWKP